jgi:hypothetical protein
VAVLACRNFVQPGCPSFVRSSRNIRHAAICDPFKATFGQIFALAHQLDNLLSHTLHPSCSSVNSQITSSLVALSHLPFLVVWVKASLHRFRRTSHKAVPFAVSLLTSNCEEFESYHSALPHAKRGAETRSTSQIYAVYLSTLYRVYARRFTPDTVQPIKVARSRGSGLLFRRSFQGCDPMFEDESTQPVKLG